MIAAAAAIVLILSMFLDWYVLDLPEQVEGQQIDVPKFNAFEGLERSDVFLVVLAVLALIFAGMLVARMLSNSPWPGLALLGAGLLALAGVIYRGSSRPVRPFFGGEIDTTLQFGWFVALVAAGTIALGGLLAYLAGPRLQLEEDEFDEDEEPGPEPRREGA
jgi:di/tricarboxylate transporter